MKKRFLIPLLLIGAPIAIGTADAAIHIAGCNLGNQGACAELARREQDATEKAAKAKAEQDKADAKRAASEAKRQALIDAAHARADAAKLKASEEIAKAEAKFKAEGWFQLQPGIYGRWCTQTCNNSKVIGDNRYSLMEVWAKDRAAGDIYAQVNLERNGVVIGWTNDTAYLSHGQRGVLTFDSHQYFDQAQLTKFNARG